MEGYDKIYLVSMQFTVRILERASIYSLIMLLSVCVFIQTKQAEEDEVEQQGDSN